ncbi:MAG TPA: SufS family cysteine desulfurase [Candidatus Rikenella faecigallinarum]|uniref:Cysteine desulfurase n=1 Tax=Candidatus Rikenella faecigallinarum TaxID=2838745 RepID=A0A9D1QDM8_9BACT|nr:SufS family cysteine desulfurase [Candidatus Rikenella faecigallinarum]
MKSLEAIRSDFPILSATVHGKPLVYLDSAATAQKPEVVIRAVDELHRTMNANIHRGIHYMAEETTARYEAARERVRALLNAASTREIVFTSGATQSINLVATSFGDKYIRQGDNILITEMEHHSNIVPWQIVAERWGAEVRVIPFDETGALRLDLLPELMDEKTRIVAVTQASNVLGTMPDLRKIIDLAHARDIPVLVDGCQGVVHTRTNVQALDCDFYAFSGHKLYGPTGIGVLYGKEKWLAALPPYMGGGDMVQTVTIPRGTTFAELPLKFEAGTSNYIGAIALGTAIDYLNDLDSEWIHSHEESLLRHVTEQLQLRVEGIRIYGSTPGKSPIVSFTVEGTHPADIGMIVDKLGVAIRTGTHCAEPVMTHYGTTAMCRLSIGLYNTKEEMDVAVAAIQRAAAMLR